MVSDDVYERLKRIKRPGESFSDVIRRLLEYKPRLMEIAGSKTVTVKDWEKVMAIFKDQEKLDDVRRRYLLGLIEK
jgi:predicted CopG family antitoxin